jgi:hypothetical protein
MAWQKNLEENKLIVIKDFAKNFQEKFQELVCNYIREVHNSVFDFWSCLKILPVA